MTEDSLARTFIPTPPNSNGRVDEDQSPYTLAPPVARVRAGLPFDEFLFVRDLYDLPELAFAKFLSMSAATLHRRKKAGKLSSAESERLIRYARLFGQAMEFIESEEGARNWLKTANPGTAGESPLSYADTEIGAREVENLLGRLEHGVF